MPNLSNWQNDYGTSLAGKPRIEISLKNFDTLISSGA
jgi:hypothetical protein